MQTMPRVSGQEVIYLDKDSLSVLHILQCSIRVKFCHCELQCASFRYLPIGRHQSCRAELGMLPNEMMSIVHLAFDGEFAG